VIASAGSRKRKRLRANCLASNKTGRDAARSGRSGAVRRRESELEKEREQTQEKAPRASTRDPEARLMKIADDHVKRRGMLGADVGRDTFFVVALHPYRLLASCELHQHPHGATLVI
jgi:hypothetical protein